MQNVFILLLNKAKCHNHCIHSLSCDRGVIVQDMPKTFLRLVMLFQLLLLFLTL